MDESSLKRNQTFRVKLKGIVISGVRIIECLL